MFSASRVLGLKAWTTTPDSAGAYLAELSPCLFNSVSLRFERDWSLWIWSLSPGTHPSLVLVVEGIEGTRNIGLGPSAPWLVV